MTKLKHEHAVMNRKRNIKKKREKRQRSVLPFRSWKERLVNIDDTSIRICKDEDPK